MQNQAGRPAFPKQDECQTQKSRAEEEEAAGLRSEFGGGGVDREGSGPCGCTGKAEGSRRVIVPDFGEQAGTREIQERSAIQLAIKIDHYAIDCECGKAGPDIEQLHSVGCTGRGEGEGGQLRRVTHETE